jgi:hypothetical protein
MVNTVQIRSWAYLGAGLGMMMYAKASGASFG